MTQPPVPQQRALSRWQRTGFALLLASVLLSTLSGLAALMCVLFFLLWDDKALLTMAMSLAGVWLGFGLLNARIMHPPAN